MAPDYTCAQRVSLSPRVRAAGNGTGERVWGCASRDPVLQRVGLERRPGGVGEHFDPRSHKFRCIAYFTSPPQISSKFLEIFPLSRFLRP